MKTNDTILMRVRQWAREDAEKSLAFIGEKPFAGMTKEKADEIKAGLIHFAEAGATLAVQTLQNHGNKLVI